MNACAKMLARPVFDRASIWYLKRIQRTFSAPFTSARQIFQKIGPPFASEKFGFDTMTCQGRGFLQEVPAFSQYMQDLKKILVPADFSRHSEYALEVAASLARRRGAAIVVLHMLGLS